jgi:hypothetical protein
MQKHRPRDRSCDWEDLSTKSKGKTRQQEKLLLGNTGGIKSCKNWEIYKSKVISEFKKVEFVKVLKQKSIYVLKQMNIYGILD